MNLDWHGADIARSTAVDAAYKNTQNVRRFMARHCGADFKFDRAFMAWIRDGAHKTMGDVVDEWLRRRSAAQIDARTDVQTGIQTDVRTGA
ncbi:DUF6434 domain-containing protein [Rugamonas sp.]|uniref:DUF6434 domain-containing protein n=1 Tax=Rugamonas sp. TaxID=1926287 RepID=UPI0025F9CD84|nr:DUF6434 domain-containing protein [Rugamonas sp.]